MDNIKETVGKNEYIKNHSICIRSFSYRIQYIRGWKSLAAIGVKEGQLQHILVLEILKNYSQWLMWASELFFSFKRDTLWRIDIKINKGYKKPWLISKA